MSSEITAGLERKLRSVQELIDSKQYKKALKQVNQHLKKAQHPMLQCFKALSLQKLGEESQALSLLEEVMSEKPSNPSLLSLIGIVYKELGRNDRLNQIQLEIFNQSPSKEKGEIVFNSFASVYNYKEQYNVAMKLYKLYNDAKYGLWAVESMILIAIHDKSNIKMLDLACLFLNKVKNAPEFANMREVAEIEILIEETRGKNDKIVELLSKNRAIVNDAMIREAETLEKLEKLNEALALLDEILAQENCLDLRIFYKHSDITIKLQNLQSWAQLPESISFNKFEQMIASEASSSSLKRTARLSQFYIFQHIIKSDTTESPLLLSKIADYLLSYFEIPSVVEDLKPVLVHLSSDQVDSLLSSISHFNLPDFSSYPELSKILTYSKVSFKFQKPLEDSFLVSLYEKSLNFEPAPKKGEHRQGDYFLMVRSLNHPLKHLASHFELEKGVQMSQYNYFLKLQLIENLRETEFVRKIIEIYDGLDIKSVQHESLGYLVFSELNDWRLFKAELGKLLTSSEKFHKYYALDLADTTSQAYTYSHLSQVLDFAQFKEKIEKSLYFNMTKVTNHYLELVRKLQEGPGKVNTGFLHVPLDWFTVNIDTNVLNDFLPLKKVDNPKSQHFGRWSNLKFFDFERLAGAFVCEFLYEEGKAAETASEMTKLVQELEGSEDFYKLSYSILASMSSGLIKLRQGLIPETKQNFAQVCEALDSLESKLLSFPLIQLVKAGAEFEYSSFITDLKKLAFLFNTFAPVFGIQVSLARPLLPAEAARKKKAGQVNLSTEITHMISKLMKIFEEVLNSINNEKIYASIDQDLTINQEIERVLMSSISKEEKIKEVCTSRKALLKDLHNEIHSIKGSLSVLLSKSR